MTRMRHRQRAPLRFLMKSPGPRSDRPEQALGIRAGQKVGLARTPRAPPEGRFFECRENLPWQVSPSARRSHRRRARDEQRNATSRVWTRLVAKYEVLQRLRYAAGFSGTRTKSG